MQPTSFNSQDDRQAEEPRGTDTYTVGEAMLARARSVGERITERCRQVAGDTQIRGDDGAAGQRS